MTEEAGIKRVLAEAGGFVIFGEFRLAPGEQLSDAHTSELQVLSLGAGLVDGCTVKWGEGENLHHQTFPMFIQLKASETAVCVSGIMLGEWFEEARRLRHNVDAMSVRDGQITLTIHAIGSAGRSDLSVQPKIHWFAGGGKWEDRHFAFDLSPLKSDVGRGDS